MSLLRDRRTTVLGFVAAIAVLAVVFSAVGIRETVRTLGTADGRVVALLVPVALAWLLSWGLALRVVLDRLGAEVGVLQAFMTFAAATFANNVTPFGQAGGEPITAYVISSSSDAEFETGLAAIASVDTLHLVPSVSLAGAGLAYLATQVTFGRPLQFAAALMAGIAVATPVLAYAGWRYRTEVEAASVRALSPLVELAGRAVPQWTVPSAGALRGRVRSFFESIERVAGDRRSLLAATGYSLLGWLGLMTSLWLSLYALGATVPVAVVVVAVPVASTTGVAPLPGGLGPFEGVLVAVLAVVPGVGPATAGAAVVLHRAATYWLPVLVGGASAVLLTTGDGEWLPTR